MKADTVDLSVIFGKPVHYIVPLYQRPYVWTREDQWEPLWQDVRDVANRQMDDTPANDNIPHFLGAVVLEQALVPTGMIDARSVVDGQQRLTTLQLLIAAARSIAIEHNASDPRQMFEKLLFNEKFLAKQSGDELKVFPTFRDRLPFRESIEDGIVAASGGHRIHEAYRFFRTSIREWIDEAADAAEAAKYLEALSTAIWKRLVVVTIDLDPGDNSQIIFETLNARGTPLLAADLVKNHLFQVATVQGEDIGALYETYWKTLDTDWWREEVVQGRLRRPRLDLFLFHWLTMSSGREFVSHELFQGFKRHLSSGTGRAADVLADLARYAPIYERFEKEPRDSNLGQFLYHLNVLDVTTAYPALLWLLGPEGFSDVSERDGALAAIESWLFRRMMTRQTTKAYNVVFLALLNSVRDAVRARGTAPRANDIIDYLTGLRGESRLWPSDAMVDSALSTLPIYQVFTRNRVRVLLEALELELREAYSEKVSLPTDLTIEHVLPQHWEQHWPLPEAADALQARLDRDQAKHRLGNLTLVTGRLNPKMSNAGWADKRPTLQKFSVMRISSDIVTAANWDESLIAERGQRLTQAAIARWARPEGAESLEDLRDDDVPGVEGPKGVIAVAGPPDPQRPHELARALGAADEIGVGSDLRRVIATSRKLGLAVLPNKEGVSFASPGRHRSLFALTPSWKDEGSFAITKWPSAFSEEIRGLTLEEAQAALGTSEEEGVVMPEDLDAVLDAIASLVPVSWAPPAFAEGGVSPGDLEGIDRIPTDVLKFIEGRAGSDPAIALRFGVAATELDGVFLRAQKSINVPWYYQVRHPKFRQVVAYVNPHPGFVVIDYRLPSSHEKYGLATPRKNFYGIRLPVRGDTEMPTALQLLKDALAQPA